MNDPSKFSGVEKVKLSSNSLRGSIAAELANDRPDFDEQTVQLLKHHGMYQQDDRDRRNARGADGKKLGKVWSLMVRVKIPGGVLNYEQLLAQIEPLREPGQWHDSHHQPAGLPASRRVEEERAAGDPADQRSAVDDPGGLRRRGAERALLPGPLPQRPGRAQMQETARRISAHLLPRSPAYHEIWLHDPEGGPPQLCGGPSNGQPVEPLYGNAYLPRKFKTAIGAAGRQLRGSFTPTTWGCWRSARTTASSATTCWSGAAGVTPSDKKTFPAIAKRLLSSRRTRAAVAEAVVKVFRDHGNRADRKRARLKYLIADWGLEGFRVKVEAYLRPPAGPRRSPTTCAGFDDHIGWRDQGDGRWFSA